MKLKYQESYSYEEPLKFSPDFGAVKFFFPPPPFLSLSLSLYCGIHADVSQSKKSLRSWQNWCAEKPV
jgi:hypothetical protein